ncbi:hypothetical protein NPIL_152781 [Nephila pilipes]|uniref:Uncharacterized protein n=1 Tax=Nephila pilipes TaxID=299642 RepID=A0A8X6MPS6_NEPPI|nr:hypothetical protein NPIL_152781 [Nephila pilipes]
MAKGGKLENSVKGGKTVSRFWIGWQNGYYSAAPFGFIFQMIFPVGDSCAATDAGGCLVREASDDTDLGAFAHVSNKSYARVPCPNREQETFRRHHIAPPLPKVGKSFLGWASRYHGPQTQTTASH